jgi:hypothetical protein
VDEALGIHAAGDRLDGIVVRDHRSLAANDEFRPARQSAGPTSL